MYLIIKSLHHKLTRMPAGAPFLEGAFMFPGLKPRLKILRPARAFYAPHTCTIQSIKLPNSYCTVVPLFRQADSDH